MFRSPPPFRPSRNAPAQDAAAAEPRPLAGSPGASRALPAAPPRPAPGTRALGRAHRSLRGGGDAGPLRASGAPLAGGGGSAGAGAGSRSSRCGRAVRLAPQHGARSGPAGLGGGGPGLRGAQHRAAPRPHARRDVAGAHRQAEQKVPEPSAGAGDAPGLQLRPGQAEPGAAAAAGERQDLPGHQVPGAAGAAGSLPGQAAAPGSLHGQVDPGERRAEAAGGAGRRGGQRGGPDGTAPVLGPPRRDLCGVLPTQQGALPPAPHPAGKAAGDPQAGEGEGAREAGPRQRGAAGHLPGATPRPASPGRAGAERTAGSQGLPAPSGTGVPDPLRGRAAHPCGSSPPEVPPARHGTPAPHGTLCEQTPEPHRTLPPATSPPAAPAQEEGAAPPVAARAPAGPFDQSL